MIRVLWSLALLFLTASQASASSADELIDRVQNKYDSVPSYSAAFVQYTYLRNGTEPVAEVEGHAAFKKPGMMRIAFTSTGDEFLSDGITLWHHEPRDKQVTITPAEHFLDSTAAISFLAGKGNLRDEFEVSLGRLPEAIPAPSGEVVKLTPRTDRAIRKLLLVVDSDSGLVQESWLYGSVGGTITRMRFLNPETGIELDDGHFSFEPPFGTDVVRPFSAASTASIE